MTNPLLAVTPSQTFLSRHNLLALAECLIEVVKDQAVPDVLVVVDTLNNLLAALGRDRDRRDPRVNLLLASEVHHGEHLWAVTNVRGTDVAAVGSKVLGHELGQGLVAEADVVELAHDLEGGEVVLELEPVGRVGAVDDEIELELPGLSPVLLGGVDEVLCAELEGIVALGRGVGDYVGFGAEGDGPEDAEVAEAAAGVGLVWVWWR